MDLDSMGSQSRKMEQIKKEDPEFTQEGGVPGMRGKEGLR